MAVEETFRNRGRTQLTRCQGQRKPRQGADSVEREASSVGAGLKKGKSNLDPQHRKRADAAGSPSALSVAPLWPLIEPLRGGHGQRTGRLSALLLHQNRASRRCARRLAHAPLRGSPVCHASGQAFSAWCWVW